MDVRWAQKHIENKKQDMENELKKPVSTFIIGDFGLYYRYIVPVKWVDSGTVVIFRKKR